VTVEQVGDRVSQFLANELSRIEREVVVERAWWGGRVVAEEEAVLGSGELVEVPIEGYGFRLIGRLRKGEEPRWLRPEAYKLLLDLACGWRRELDVEEGGWLDVFLSVTSLYRSSELQARLVLQNTRATRGLSAHGAGAAFDIDLRGYYVGECRQPVNCYSEGYNPRYMELLRVKIRELEDSGRCHAICELGCKGDDQFLSVYPVCYHVCVSPVASKQ